MLQSKGNRKKFIFYFFILFFLSSINNLSFFRLSDIKFNVSNIKVAGLSNTKNFQISKSLDKLNLQNIFFLKKNDISKIIEKNNFIKNFTIKKIYPNTILINIKKTKYVGIIINDNKKFLIGSNAKLIPFTKNNDNLPYVFGNVDLYKFLKFIEIIKKSNFKYIEITEIYYFPSGRWDVKNKKNVLFRFPEKNLLSTLNFAYKIKENKEFINHNIIDLRILKRVVLNNV